MEKGAAEFQKIITQLQLRGLPSGLIVQQKSADQLWVEKRSTGSENRTEFSFFMRVERTSGRETWWPVEYRSAAEVISCETFVNGKVMVNLVKQDALIELAETWAKTLQAQQTAKAVGNALL